MSDLPDRPGTDQPVTDQPVTDQPVTVRPTRRPAVVLGFGALVLVLSAVPFLNLVGVVLGVLTIRSGIRSLGRGRAVAGLGVVAAALGVVVSLVVTITVGRGLLLDATLSSDPPDPSGEAGSWVRLDRGDDLEARVDSVRCTPRPVAADGSTCRVDFQVRNGGSEEVDLDGSTVALVVDGDYETLSLDDLDLVVRPGATTAGSGGVTVRGAVTGVAFNPFDVRGSGTTVIAAP